MITNDYVKFFKGLEKNNNKEWFQGQKKEYEDYVRKPFINLIESLIPPLSELEPMISHDAKDALFRINKDIRFSKDKTPYNTIMKAALAPGGKKAVLPGFYIGIDAHKIHIGGGLYNLSTDDLRKVRSLIASKSSAFLSIINKASFKSYFDDIKGERAKRIDKEFQDLSGMNPYIMNKQFYAMAELDLSTFLNKGELTNTLLNYFREINPLNQFLKQALL